MAESGSLTVYPGAYDTSDVSTGTIQNEANPVGKGASNTTYCRAYPKKANEDNWIRWPFDLSVIPNNAEIDSVQCKLKAKVPSTGYVLSATANLATGSTQKGSSVDVRNTTEQTYTIQNTGAWTRTELQKCNLCFLWRSNVTTASGGILFYGADLTVTYTYQSEKFMLKLGGAWTDVARVFKKVNDIWVEQTDLANVIEDGVRYKNGGEIVKPITVDITASGNYSYAYAEINGVKYYSNGGSTEVNAGDVITFCVYNGGALKIDGETVLTAASGATSTYDWTVPSGITKIEIAPLYYTVIYQTYYGSVTVTTTGGDSSANLITFTVDGVSYQAEEGMTWTQFIASIYNPGDFLNYLGGVAMGSKWVYTSSGVNPPVEDAIIPGEAYYTG